MQKKALGQSFLVNNELAKKFIDALDISSSDKILEIGGGDGALSRLIAEKDYKSYLILEIDPFYQSKLSKEFSRFEKTSVELGNILHYDIESKDINTIIGAIPYYITSPIIHIILNQSESISKFGLIIQKEVAEKIKPTKNSRELSYWSLITYYYDIETVCQFKSIDFNPPPKVDSTALKFIKNETRYSEFKSIFKDSKQLSKFAHRIFLNPRKMLNKTFTKEELGQSNIDPNLRPHQLDVSDVIRLYKTINKC